MATTIRPPETHYVHAHTLSYRAMTLRYLACTVLQQEDWKVYLAPNLSWNSSASGGCVPQIRVSVSITRVYNRHHFSLKKEAALDSGDLYAFRQESEITIHALMFRISLRLEVKPEVSGHIHGLVCCPSRCSCVHLIGMPGFFLHTTTQSTTIHTTNLICS